MRRHHVWTPRQEEVLIDLKDNQGIEWKYIAKRLGKTVTTCKARYNKIKEQVT